jgi:hypothetical protein
MGESDVLVVEMRGRKYRAGHSKSLVASILYLVIAVVRCNFAHSYYYCAQGPTWTSVCVDLVAEVRYIAKPTSDNAVFCPGDAPPNRSDRLPGTLTSDYVPVLPV